MNDIAPRERLREQTPFERRLRGACLMFIALAALPCCAESGMDSELGASAAPATDAAAPVWPVPPGVVAPSYDAATQTGSNAQPVEGGAVVDAAAPVTVAARDAAAPAVDPFSDLLDDVFGGAGDAGFTPPAAASGAWKLDDGSAPECPAEPPPIPIIGGPCLGIYFSCGWTDTSGATYTCICDWVHWLCI